MSLPVHCATEHIFTVDVEEYFQVAAFDRVLSREDWDAQPSRLEHSVGILLELLARHQANATFFTLGWVAERHPFLMRRIADAGHEIASHGHLHRRVNTLTPDEFRDDVRVSKAILEEHSGAPVWGFRAPNFSITPGTEWAFDILIEEGFRYDSSLFPINRPGYGNPKAPPVPHLIHRPAGTLTELPLATTQWRGMRISRCGRRVSSPSSVPAHPARLPRARCRRNSRNVLHSSVGARSRTAAHSTCRGTRTCGTTVACAKRSRFSSGSLVSSDSGAWRSVSSYRRPTRRALGR